MCRPMTHPCPRGEIAVFVLHVSCHHNGVSLARKCACADRRVVKKHASVGCLFIIVPSEVPMEPMDSTTGKHNVCVG